MWGGVPNTDQHSLLDLFLVLSSEYTQPLGDRKDTGPS